MDPNETLLEIRKICTSWENVHNETEPYNDPWYYIDDLIDLIKSLDNWLTSGGFRPDDWS